VRSQLPAARASLGELLTLPIQSQSCHCRMLHFLVQHPLILCLQSNRATGSEQPTKCSCSLNVRVQKEAAGACCWQCQSAAHQLTA
jgi:hypothetical protein